MMNQLHHWSSYGHKHSEGKDEASDGSSDDDSTPKGDSPSERKQREVLLWIAANPQLSEKEKSLIGPPTNTPHVRPPIYKDSDSDSTTKHAMIGETLTGHDSDSHENSDFQVGAQ